MQKKKKNAKLIRITQRRLVSKHGTKDEKIISPLLYRNNKDNVRKVPLCETVRKVMLGRECICMISTRRVHTSARTISSFRRDANALGKDCIIYPWADVDACGASCPRKYSRFKTTDRYDQNTTFENTHYKSRTHELSIIKKNLNNSHNNNY